MAAGQEGSEASTPATVAVERHGKPHPIGETSIHVVKFPPEVEVQFKVEPAGVEEGEPVELEVGNGPDKDVLDAAKLHWQFTTGNKGAVEREDFARASWDTSGVAAGTHDCRCSAGRRTRRAW